MSVLQTIAIFMLENAHPQTMWYVDPNENDKWIVKLDAWDCWIDSSYDAECVNGSLNLLGNMLMIKKIVVQCCYEDNFTMQDGSRGCFWTTVPDYIVDIITNALPANKVVLEYSPPPE